MIDIYNRYRVDLMYGGESPNEVRWCFSLAEARACSDNAEHSIITYRGKEIE